MTDTNSSPSSAKQIATGALLVAVAIGITLAFHTSPAFHEWRAGRSTGDQLLVALAFLLLAWAGTVVAFRVPKLRNAITVPPGLSNVNLSGVKPLSIALAAGIGEELLFRAALQPLAGLWIASALFALAHLRTATLAGSNLRKAIYLSNVFVVGVGLGLVFQYVGLIAAILIHATIDLAALLSLRKLQVQTHAVSAN
jgi:uncharacterized protein